MVRLPFGDTFWAGFKVAASFAAGITDARDPLHQILAFLAQNTAFGATINANIRGNQAQNSIYWVHASPPIILPVVENVLSIPQLLLILLFEHSYN
jgi:hypothetical protein